MTTKLNEGTTPDSIRLNAQSTVDYTVEAFPVMIDNNERYKMGIATEEGCIYLTREQAIAFFNIREAE